MSIIENDAINQAAMQPALDNSTSALERMLAPMRRVRNMRLSNAVSTSLDTTNATTTTSCACANGVNAQFFSRAALHQVTCGCTCNQNRRCRMPPPYEPPTQADA